MSRLILASTSTYRHQLLTRLGLPFDVVAPQIVEDRLPNEDPIQLVTRLALAKAEAVQQNHPQHVIIGSDQVAVLDGVIMGKPGTIPNAVEQLSQSSGRTVSFHTGVCCLRGSVIRLVDCVTTRVVFRRLDPDKIRRYILRDLPLDAAGSFKSEGLGITLFERIEGDDPTALVGLPLIRLSGMLEQAGMTLY
ncbi:MAG: septum formation inhibitor Maf [Magnetococcales bacterium]|nr:septum formation inhibitor Maf [Magnetococcales bacterium]